MIAVLAVAMIVKIQWPPDAYYADAFWRAAFHFFDPGIFKVRVVQLLLLIAVIYGVLHASMGKLGWRASCPAAVVTSFAILLVYWLALDNAVHASDRYYLRTFLVVVIPLFGGSAALVATNAQAAIPAWLERMRRPLVSPNPRMACAGVSLFALISAIHIVETRKFVSGWDQYRSAVARLAKGDDANPDLGDPRFVSSARLAPELGPWSWFSTTPYMSILLADFAPNRLVIDPTGNYFWLSCATANRNRDAASAVPEAARELVRVYSCQHRPD
jgi:hypothetical protein